jgi:hypothetical protein
MRYILRKAQTSLFPLTASTLLQLTGCYQPIVSHIHRILAIIKYKNMYLCLTEHYAMKAHGGVDV